MSTPPILPPPLRPSEQQEQRLRNTRRRAARARKQRYLGAGLLLAGYAVLTVSPDTPTEWALLRVILGFGLLFIGFALAIAPWLSSVSGGE